MIGSHSNRGVIARRRFLARTSACAAGSLLASFSLTLGRTGKSIAAAFDAEMEQFMSARKVPGGALAVVKDQRLVYTRGYGWADRERQEPVKSESLFRIASISKPITAVAVLKLVEAGRLEMEARVFDLLGLEPAPAAEPEFDSRWKRITVRHCLHHTGGWDRDQSGDPMFQSVEIARALKVRAPARQEAIIRYMVGRRLDFDPGQRYAYSNFGYCVLGRVIEKITGLSYGKFVMGTLLAPLGAGGMILGASLEQDRAPREVKYYTPADRKGESVFPGCVGKVPAPYGTFCLEAMDSHGGWLASAIDLARFVAVLDRPASAGCLLKPETLRLLYEPPAEPVSRKKDGMLAPVYYACGWDVRPVGNGGRANYWHNGSLPGTFTLLVRRHDGLSWAALFNQRSTDAKLPDNAIDSALHRGADAVAEWPAHDLFRS